LSIDKIDVVYNGVDLEKFKAVNTSQTLGRLGINCDYILLVGSMDPRKNVQRALEAWLRIKDQAVEALLVVVGAANKKVFSELELPFHQSIIFTGYLQDNELIELYTHSKGLVFPSLYEGFGLPALESLACGTRVVISENTAVSEVVGRYGITIDPKSVDEISNGIRALLSCDMNFPYEECRAYISQMFSWSEVANKIVRRVRD
jgi:glycosyltransferase involved in cell wall biosynthesis